MNYSIIGAGRTGSFLGKQLVKTSHTLSGIFSRTAESAEKLANTLRVNKYDRLEEAVGEGDVIFLTVNDDAIAALAAKIADEQSEGIAGKCFFHCSGALTSEVLAPLRSKGAETGSLHPLASFCDKSHLSDNIEVVFTYEGGEDAAEIAERTVESLCGRMYRLNIQAKVLYHAAACILSNYSVALALMAEEILKSPVFNDMINLDLFMPLWKGTLENIEQAGAGNALTGPIIRGDVNVVKKHLEELHRLKNGKRLAEVYSGLGNILLDFSAGDKRMRNVLELQDVLNHPREEGV